MFDFGDIQGNVLRVYRYPAARHVFVTLPAGDVEAARNLVSTLAAKVTTESTAETWPPSTLNVAFTHHGLTTLGLPPTVLDSFADEFRAGMPARAGVLGDVGDSDPRNWEMGLGTDAGTARMHACISVHGIDPATVAQRCAAIKGEHLDAHGATICFEQDTVALDGFSEHFGFRDALSDTAVEGSGIDPAKGHGLPMPDGSWKAVAPGEFLFGHVSELGALPEGPKPDELAKNGTYLVMRKLRQNVWLFREYLKANATRLGTNVEWLAARMVGRWRDGTPLALSPDAPWGQARVDSDPDVNRFRYSDDPNGQRVPLGSHLRRVNPRDGLRNGIGFVRNHRLIRRGLPFGPALPETATQDDGMDRGVWFMAMNASIRDQFEFVQADWINDGSFAGLDSGQQDPLLGDGTGNGMMTIPLPNGAKKRLFALPRFVTVRFGVYLFLPGIRALGYLSRT